MAKRRRKKRYVLRPKAFLIVGGIIVGVVLLVLLIIALGRRGDLKTVTSTMSMNLKTDAIVVRDEACYKVDYSFDRAIYLAAEGSTVNVGTPLARVFRIGYTDDIMQSVYNVQSQILEVQNELLEGVDTPDLDAINAEILEKLHALDGLHEGESGKTLTEIENELSVLLQARYDLMSTKVQATEELTKLFEEESDKLVLQKDWMSDVVSSEAGTVSFYFDGYEQAINVEKSNIITAPLLKSALRESVAKSIAQDTVYRIVNVNNWQVAFLTTADSPIRLTAGENYTVTFAGFEDAPFGAKALSVRTSGDDVVNVLTMEGTIGGLMSLRSVKATITQTFTGMRVLESAVKMVDGVARVTFDKSGAKVQIPVDVLCVSDGYALVRPVSDSDTIYDGQKYYK